MQKESKNAVSTVHDDVLDKTTSQQANSSTFLKSPEKDIKSLLLIENKILKEENRHLKKMDELQKQIMKINKRIIDLYSNFDIIPELSREPQNTHLKVCR